jgi:hypothetical protein
MAEQGTRQAKFGDCEQAFHGPLNVTAMRLVLATRTTSTSSVRDKSTGPNGPTYPEMRTATGAETRAKVV